MCHTGHEFRDPKPLNPEPGTRNTEPETRNPEIWSLEPETPKSGARNPTPRNPEPGTRNTDLMGITKQPQRWHTSAITPETRTLALGFGVKPGFGVG